MPRNYKPDPHGKRYNKHSPESIKSAINKIRAGLSIREAARRAGIPNSVLRRHYKNPDTLPQGGPTALPAQEEQTIVERILICSKWGYPMDRVTLRLFIKSYLDNRGKTIRRFKDNTPGNEFIYGFLKRHQAKLAERMCQNIKRSRAEVTRSVLREYFNNLKTELENVPKENIINYDETNLSNDPGRKKIITKRVCKYPEKVMNSSKSATSIMMACSANGELLPVYVVYKSLHLYDKWIENGPEKTWYNRSKSGWFDAVCFEDWLKKVAIPFLKRKVGTKILIGDNLSCHLSTECVRLCQQYDIKMVFLPPNSTHLTQPLDVSFFGPMKKHWRSILATWKLGPGRKETSVPKDTFPALLKQLLMKLNKNSSDNIISGFKKCGIVPFNPESVLSLVPDIEEETSNVINQTMDQSLINLLSEMRGADTSTPRQRKKKLKAQPGKSVAAESSSDSEDIDGDLNEILASDNSNEGNGDNSNESDQDSSNENDNNNSNETDSEEPDQNEDEENNPEDVVGYELNQNDFVIVKFKTNKRSRRFIAQVQSVAANWVTVKCLRKRSGKNTTFVFPAQEDICDLKPKDIERRIVLMNEKRGHHSFCVDVTNLE